MLLIILTMRLKLLSSVLRQLLYKNLCAKMLGIMASMQSVVTNEEPIKADMILEAFNISFLALGTTYWEFSGFLTAASTSLT